MQEKVRRFAMQLPERVASAPEWMLFIDPFAFFLVLLVENWSVCIDGFSLEFHFTFHLKPRRLKVSFSWSVALENNWPYTIELRSQFQSFLVTSETNQGYRLPWNLIWSANPP